MFRLHAKTQLEATRQKTRMDVNVGKSAPDGSNISTKAESEVKVHPEAPVCGTVSVGPCFVCFIGSICTYCGYLSCVFMVSFPLSDNKVK